MYLSTSPGSMQEQMKIWYSYIILASVINALVLKTWFCQG